MSTEDEAKDKGLGESRPSPSRRRKGRERTKLPKTPAGQQRRIADKTGEQDQPPKPKRRKSTGAPRRPGKRGYKGPRPNR